MPGYFHRRLCERQIPWERLSGGGAGISCLLSVTGLVLKGKCGRRRRADVPESLLSGSNRLMSSCGNTCFSLTNPLHIFYIFAFLRPRPERSRLPRGPERIKSSAGAQRPGKNADASKEAFTADWFFSVGAAERIGRKRVCSSQRRSDCFRERPHSFITGTAAVIAAGPRRRLPEGRSAAFPASSPRKALTASEEPDELCHQGRIRGSRSQLASGSANSLAPDFPTSRPGLRPPSWSPSNIRNRELGSAPHRRPDSGEPPLLPEDSCIKSYSLHRNTTEQAEGARRRLRNTDEGGNAGTQLLKRQAAEASLRGLQASGGAVVPLWVRPQPRTQALHNFSRHSRFQTIICVNISDRSG